MHRSGGFQPPLQHVRTQRAFGKVSLCGSASASYKIAKLGCPSADHIERFAEIKATRDALVHNKGIANRVYIDKAMGRARFRDGDKIEVPATYHRDSWRLVKQIITDLADAGIRKAWSQT
jgi:hypothetical protein